MAPFCGWGWPCQFSAGQDVNAISEALAPTLLGNSLMATVWRLLRLSEFATGRKDVVLDRGLADLKASRGFWKLLEASSAPETIKLQPAL